MSGSRRRRLAAAAIGLVLVAAGLGSRLLAPGTVVVDVLGDALYAALISMLVVVLAPRMRPALVAALALAWCAGVELFQLTGLPVQWAADVPVVALVLGTGFDPRDLLVYAASVGVVAAVDIARVARGGRRGDHGTMPPASVRRRWLPLAIAAAALAVAAVVLIVVMGMDRGAAVPVAAAPSTPAATPKVTPSPTPTDTGAPVDATSYDTAGLPAAEVYSVIPALPVDTDPSAPPAGFLATPAAAVIPVFAAPGQAPVATLPQTQTYGGTTVPVVERQTNWVRVLLSGRQGTPPGGNPAQLSGWLRTSDVTLTEDATRVDVSLSARTISIVSPSGTEVVATDFGWGAAATPTPLGRTFIMHTAVVPSFGYTRGHPLVYLGVQSPTLAGFSGASVAVTAFHYHDAHSGAISNGCLRLDAAAIDRLAQLPLGTPVVVSG